MLLIPLGLIYVAAYIYAAAYVTADTSVHGGPTFIVGLLALTALPIGVAVWLLLRSRWEN